MAIFPYAHFYVNLRVFCVSSFTSENFVQFFCGTFFQKVNLEYFLKSQIQILTLKTYIFRIRLQIQLQLNFFEIFELLLSSAFWGFFEIIQVFFLATS